MKVVTEAAEELGVAAACAAVGLPRATYYRRIAKPKERTTRPPSHRALPPEDRKAVLDLLHDERFVDAAPAQVYATLLDEGRYICSERTMYRLPRSQQGSA